MTEIGSPFRVVGTEHTGITVRSLDEALSFWSGVLGFEHIYTWDFGKESFLADLVGVKFAAARIAMVKGPGHFIELLEYYSPDDRQTVTPRSCDVGSVHVAYRVAGIEALLARIASSGWGALSDVQQVKSGDRAGLRLVYVQGPDGVTLEFLEYPSDWPVPAP